MGVLSQCFWRGHNHGIRVIQPFARESVLPFILNWTEAKDGPITAACSLPAPSLDKAQAHRHMCMHTPSPYFQCFEVTFVFSPPNTPANGHSSSSSLVLARFNQNTVIHETMGKVFVLLYLWRSYLLSHIAP